MQRLVSGRYLVQMQCLRLSSSATPVLSGYIYGDILLGQGSGAGSLVASGSAGMQAIAGWAAWCLAFLQLPWLEQMT